MKIDVQYVAQMRSAAGCSGETVDVDPGTTVAGVLRHIADCHGDPLCGLLLDDSGGIRPTAVVFLGDTQHDPGDDEPLSEGATVTLLAPLAGG